MKPKISKVNDLPKSVQQDAAAPLTVLEQAAQLRALTKEFEAVEQAIRHFQGTVTAVNTDAGYEVKRAADYFVDDVLGGISEVVTALTANPDYTPDAFAAAVLQGQAADVALIEANPLPVPAPTDERRLQHVQDTIEVSDGPVAPRMKKTKREVI